MLKDVTAAADVVDRLLKDDEPVQGAADFGDRFFEDLIDALAMTSSKSAGGGMAASKAFFEQRLTIIDEQQTLWNQMHSVTDQLSREEKLTITRAFVAFEMAAFDGFKEAIADVDLPDLVVETVGPVHLKDARAPLVYYLAGWLLFTLFRLKSEDPFYAMYVSHNNISRGEAEEAKMPLGITLRRPATKGVFLASPPLFDFVWAVEATYAKLLTTANLVAYEGALVTKVNKLLSKDPAVAQCFRATITDDMKAAIATSSAEPPVAEVMQRLLDKYARMRGRDLVGKLMSNLRSAAFAANTHRGGLAAAATHAKKKSRAGERHDAGEDELDVGDVAQIYADLEAEEESLDAEALQ